MSNNAIFGHPEYYKLDDRGRIKIPTELRALFGDNRRVYVSYIEEKVARCYPGALYESKLEEILGRPHNDQERQRYFLAARVELDDQHRFTLRGKISSLRQVIIAPNGDVMDIYDPSSFPYTELLVEPPSENGPAHDKS